MLFYVTVEIWISKMSFKVWKPENNKVLKIAQYSEKSYRKDKLTSFGVKMAEIRISNLVLRAEKVRFVFVIFDLGESFYVYIYIYQFMVYTLD